ncbi:MAG: ribosomal protein S18-alanine N-acetyltransferase [Dehalococcoidia bacterium]|jgi:ribosomal-protein-alanine N-acetyltransferase
MVYAIRRMEKEDLQQVAEIDREVFPTQWPPPNYRQELNNKIARYIVAYDTARTNPVQTSKTDNNSSGFLARFTPWRKSDEKRERESNTYKSQYIIGFSGIWMMVGEAHITNIAVRQQYQRQGIGELLLIATVDLSIELKAVSMTLEVRESNTIAQNLYSKYGFTQTGLRRGYYLDNRENAIIMSTEDMKSPVFRENLEKLRDALSQKLGAAAT